MAVLCAMVHGLSQGPQFGLSCSQGPSAVGLRRQPLLPRLRTLGQDLLQGQHVPFVLLRLGQELPKYIPGGKKVKKQKKQTQTEISRLKVRAGGIKERTTKHRAQA